MERIWSAREHVLGIYRIVIGFLFACHGVKTVFGVLGGGTPAVVGSWPDWWAAVIELVGGILVCVGLGTRYAALVGSGSMAFAYFTVHQPHGALPILNGGEAAAMFCWALLLVTFTGPGRFALSALFRMRKQSREATAPRPVPARLS
jgi:putative oxidoreductase